jgi:hypothetical protein
MDMNQTLAEASLNNLHDIMLPEAIEFFPLAPGWVIVGLLGLTLIFHFSTTAYKRYKKDQYRRDALAELKTLDSPTKENFLTLLSLAKRVGIFAYGRATIAKLDVNDWWDFMQGHSNAKIALDLRSEIQKLLYGKSSVMNDEIFHDVFTFVKVWIETHKAGPHV